MDPASSAAFCKSIKGIMALIYAILTAPSGLFKGRAWQTIKSPLRPESVSVRLRIAFGGILSKITKACLRIASMAKNGCAHDSPNKHAEIETDCLVQCSCLDGRDFCFFQSSSFR